MDAIRKVLDKIDALLTTEPARMIGYGAAVIVFLVVEGIGYIRPGLLPQVSFDTALSLAFAAIAFLVVVVENIRRFVYAPQTYIEDLADEYEAGHDSGHQDGHMHERLDAALQAAQPQVQQVPVAPAPEPKPGQPN